VTFNTPIDRCIIRVALWSRDLKLSSVLSSVLGKEFAVLRAADLEKANELACNNGCDALILDIDSSFCSTDGGSAVVFDDIVTSGVPIIVMAGDENRLEAVELVERGAYGYVRNPPAIGALKTMLRRAYDGGLLKRELESARLQVQKTAGFDQLTGSSAQMQGVYGLCRRVANVDASVLITGESGTGKELVARAIHNTGNRSKRPFVAIACGAIPESLIEAELFGHEKGAFTGTIGQREGYFEKAGDGTLFLDEIGELSHQTQVKLLRVLQQREFSRLGSTRLLPLRARVLFATHRNLEQMVAKGEFRQDLFYRINVMNIQAPALRNHAEDISPLALHFLRNYSETYCKQVEAIEPDALRSLESYLWPGNVRELENVIQRAIIMAEGDVIRLSDLPEAFQELALPDFADNQLNGSFERLVGEYKIKLANEAIEECNGNKTLAAQRLSISRAYLHRLIRLLPSAPETSVTEISSGRLASYGLSRPLAFLPADLQASAG
jgi:DNA-binding NtrC family response regulator